MKANLTGTWELTTEHSASSYGQPVLVNRTTGDAYGPADVVKAYPSWGYLPAAAAVERMMKTAKLDAEGKAAAAKFCDLGKTAG